MPWTKADVDRHKEGLNDSQKERWVAIANGAREQCLEGKDNPTAQEIQECEARAIRIANSRVGPQNNGIQINVRLDGKPEEKERYGKDWLVAPVVAVREKVLADNENTPGEYLPEQVIQEDGERFEDVPIILDHPTDGDDRPISARSRQIIEERGVGRFWDVYVNGDKLKGNLWIDLAKAEAMGGEAMELVRRLRNNEMVEVSTSYFRDLRWNQGQHDGHPYYAEQRNLRPDHLAVLLDAEGKCSIADGCGAPRINKSGGEDMGLLKAVNMIRNLFRGEKTMTREEMVEALVSNSDAEPEQFEDFSDEQLKFLTDNLPCANSGDGGSEPEGDAEGKTQEPEMPKNNSMEHEVSTLKDMVSEQQETIESLKEKLANNEKEKRDELITEITTNSKWEAEELEDFKVDQLEKIAENVKPDGDFSGLGMPSNNAIGAGGEDKPRPTSYDSEKLDGGA